MALEAGPARRSRPGPNLFQSEGQYAPPAQTLPLEIRVDFAQLRQLAQSVQPGIFGPGLAPTSPCPVAQRRLTDLPEPGAKPPPLPVQLEFTPALASAGSRIRISSVLRVRSTIDFELTRQAGDQPSTDRSPLQRNYEKNGISCKARGFSVRRLVQGVRSLPERAPFGCPEMRRARGDLAEIASASFLGIAPGNSSAYGRGNPGRTSD